MVVRSTLSDVERVFPVNLPCDIRGWSDLSFQDHFLAVKPKDLVWFGYDTVIRGPTEVEFVVHDMACNITGGVGKKIASFKTTVSEGLTKGAIERRIMLLAGDRRAREFGGRGVCHHRAVRCRTPHSPRPLLLESGATAMTSQDHASHLLQVWQQRRALPPTLRLIDCPPLAPDEYEETLDAVREEMVDV